MPHAEASTSSGAGVKAGWFAVLLLALVCPGASAIAADCKSMPAPQVNWEDCTKSNIVMRGAKLGGATLAGGDFTLTDLRDADLRQADLQKATLVRSSLAGANAAGAKKRASRASSPAFGSPPVQRAA